MRLPYLPLQFTTAGTPADPAAVDAAVDRIGAGGFTDVLLLAHGWNNDLREAQELFDALADNVDSRVGAARRIVVVGVLWPSMRWADADQVAGGGLSAAGPLDELLTRIAETVPDPAAAAALSRPAVDLTDPAARAEFVARLRRLLPPPDEVADDDALPGALRSGDVEALFDAAADADRTAAGITVAAGPDPGGLPPGVVPDLLGRPAAVAATGLSLADLNPARLARLLLNTTTYYTMKDRAGKVGALGVAPLLDRVPGGVRVHLAGHSFGARVLAMAASTTVAPVHSLTLLQGAFSHHGLAGADPAAGRDAGAFRPVLERGTLRGPVVVTHTRNDKAVRLAYAVASRLARQAASDVGDENDPYGGLGANGAVHTAEAVAGTLGPDGTRYALRPGAVHNLRADALVSGHGDVRNAAVANAFAQAILAAP